MIIKYNECYFKGTCNVIWQQMEERNCLGARWEVQERLYRDEWLKLMKRMNSSIPLGGSRTRWELRQQEFECKGQGKVSVGWCMGQRGREETNSGSAETRITEHWSLLMFIRVICKKNLDFRCLTHNKQYIYSALTTVMCILAPHSQPP